MKEVVKSTPLMRSTARGIAARGNTTSSNVTSGNNTSGNATSGNVTNGNDTSSNDTSSNAKNVSINKFGYRPKVITFKFRQNLSGASPCLSNTGLIP